MTCEEARPLVYAYVDGELDVVRSLEIETHLSSCVACTRDQASLQGLHKAFSNGALYHEAPAGARTACACGRARCTPG